jgi:mannose-6-phosphate isomerase class I
VHPADGDRHLEAGECGKPESWLVLAAAPGAGIYLGFSRPVTRAELRTALLNGDQAKELLHFERVAPGDYFEIEPGVPHAIGAGVTLLEPQRILPGMAGKTYRLWDWGRKYNSAGLVDMAGGAARPLHVEESLPLVDPEAQIGARFAAGLKRRAQELGVSRGVKARVFPANPYYQTALVDCADGAQVKVDVKDGYGALIPLEGTLEVQADKPLSLAAGQPALLPHAAMPVAFKATTATKFALVTPATATPGFQ